MPMDVTTPDRYINPADETPCARELREEWEATIEEIEERLPFDGVESKLTDFEEGGASVDWTFRLVTGRLWRDPQRYLAKRLVEALVQLLGTGTSKFEVEAFHWPLPIGGGPKRKYRVTLNVET